MLVEDEIIASNQYMRYYQHPGTMTESGGKFGQHGGNQHLMKMQCLAPLVQGYTQSGAAQMLGDRWPSKPALLLW